ncbi:hypothetical protein LTR72_011272 [Exophiala xenobiotica]|nr:hypothetical protein LTR92_010804 [Exophiala xenobiotica]KAK5215687.1 hypothetical protein LTR72_011272 [Exophiala xenobiotica]KAK5284995.1 hypothetical protein LTR14_011326 [Exophiala xenobiotica]KAK5469990.1 hypothetical protein LTR55_011250 [Exophiala xenobiotica]
MHFTSAIDDPEFREMAKAVRLRAEDMIPWEGQSDSWCLPLEQLGTSPVITRLYKQFEKTKLNGIVQRRCVEQPAKRITRRHGPDIVYFPGDTPPVRENQFVVAIALEKPSIQQDITSPMLKRRHDNNEIRTEQETLPRRSENSSSHENVLKPHQKTDTELAATNVEQKKVNRTTDATATATTEAPPELSPQWQAFVEKLREEAAIVVSTWIDRGGEPVELEEGDILELDESEYLHPKAGSAGAMWISYNWL